MDTIIIRTDCNKTKALIDFQKAFDVKFGLMEENLTKNNADSGYNQEFVNQILQSREDKKMGMEQNHH